MPGRAPPAAHGTVGLAAPLRVADLVGGGSGPAAAPPPGPGLFTGVNGRCGRGDGCGLLPVESLGDGAKPFFAGVDGSSPSFARR
mmetsp:Transcript_53149/g.170295  ORF Transcript_53149/g.170295 Transcript_53149/m.170295 type:complete len:85 (-) Transcript_53149:15-269(-)